MRHTSNLFISLHLYRVFQKKPPHVKYDFLKYVCRPHNPKLLLTICNKTTIQQTVTKYCSHGTSLNKNKENSGRRRIARSEKNIELVRSTLESKPNLTRICVEKYGR